MSKYEQDAVAVRIFDKLMETYLKDSVEASEFLLVDLNTWLAEEFSD